MRKLEREVMKNKIKKNTGSYKSFSDAWKKRQDAMNRMEVAKEDGTVVASSKKTNAKKKRSFRDNPKNLLAYLGAMRNLLKMKPEERKAVNAE